MVNVAAVNMNAATFAFPSGTFTDWLSYFLRRTEQLMSPLPTATKLFADLSVTQPS